MGLKCWINGKNYDVVQGVTISEEFNETLDSGNLIISNVAQIDLKPYDDVIIYEAIDKDGNLHELNGWETGIIPENLIFYKHLLIDQFVEEVLYLGDETGKYDEFGNPIVKNMKFKYRIQLFSETKKLETIQLPNISVTQPLKERKRKSVYKILQQFLEVYNIKEKIVVDEIRKIFEYKNKYVLDKSLKDIFENVYAPEFSMNNPNLKDVISQLLITRDRIPYVENNVIKAMDISARTGDFNVREGEINYISGSFSSDNYCSNLKRTYNDALSQESTGKSVEYVGFRNSNTPLLTFENMRLELEFPIYKINKIYMCYYKKVNATSIKNDYNEDPNKDIYFLCKQDITPLIKLDSERNNLSQDWDDFNKTNPPQTIEDLAKYKLSTLGYSIGSNIIDGWGTKYTYPRGWWQADKTASYIENIFNFLDKKYPYGILNSEDFLEEGYYVAGSYPNLTDSMVWYDQKQLTLGSFNLPYMLKTMFFVVDYTPFYNGTIIHSKTIENRNDYITVNDNPSSSLTVLEMDGISQNEKLNRFGNKGLQINARYQNVNQLQPLGSVYNRGNDKDVVIYHREYSIFDNLILCSYNGSKDYVLKNFFTNVYAKHRTYGLMSYGESVKRAENKKIYLLLSKGNSFVMKDVDFNFKKFDESVVSKLLSFYKDIKSEEIVKTDIFPEKDKINFALFKYNNGEEIGYLLKDINVFVSNNSICFNATTKDNIISGPYIKQLVPDYDFLDVKEDMIGSTQDFKMFTDKYGYLNDLDFILAHIDKDFLSIDQIGEKDYVNEIKNQYYSFFSKIPYLTKEKINEIFDNINNVISVKDIESEDGFKIYKDNKEVIDMTYQFETITDDENIMFSSWLMKLCDLSGVYKKFKKTVNLKNNKGYLSKLFIYLGFKSYMENIATFPYKYEPELFLKLPNTEIFVPGKEDKVFTLDGETYEVINNKFSQNLDYDNKWYIVGFKAILEQLTIKSDGTLILKGKTKLYYEKHESWNENHKTYMIELPFEKEMVKVNVELITNENFNFYRTTFTNFNFEINGETIHFNYDNSNIIPTDSRFVYGRYNFNLDSKIFDFDPKVEDKNYIQTENINFVVSPIIVDNKNVVDVVYNKNMFFVKAPSLSKTTVYDEYRSLSDTNFVIDDDINFEIIVDPFPILEIRFGRNDYLPGDSIRLYYRNNSNFSKEQDGNYHFVFGVNLTEEDIKNRFVQIYPSLLNDKNLFVKNNKNKIIGKLFNYVNQPNKAPNNNYYEEI